MIKLSIVQFVLFPVLLIIIYLQQPALADTVDGAKGAKIFSKNCAGCHINGGNIIRRGKNLKIRALKKYKMDSVAAISNIVTYGKNNMSAYQDRLSELEIQSVSTYVLNQAENNWKKQ